LKVRFGMSPRDTSVYYGWPLLSLNMMLRLQRVPFLNNVFHLRRLERRRPKHFTLAEVGSYGPTFNPIAHESAHCIAAQRLKFDTIRSRATEERRLTILIAESYALAVEQLSGIFIPPDPISLFLHQRNAHVPRSQRSVDALQRGHRAFGAEATVAVLFAANLYALFLYLELGAEEIAQIASIISFPTTPTNRKIVREVFTSVLDVGPDFRTHITNRQLRSEGFPNALEQQLQHDPLIVLSKYPKLFDRVNTLLEPLAGVLGASL
jgi:hypothetical protein